MTAPVCMWEHCDRPARINVAVHRRTTKNFVQGAFCVPHSVLTSRAQAQVGVEVWFDWVRAGRDAESEPVELSLLSAGSALNGEPRLRRLSESDGVDPLEPAR
jgi:hypothetical protein